MMYGRGRAEAEICVLIAEAMRVWKVPHKEAQGFFSVRDCRSYAIYNLDVCQADSLWLATLFGEWLGSGADEGRAKLRYALGRRKEPLIQ
jgi:hypothetical protein